MKADERWRHVGLVNFICGEVDLYSRKHRQLQSCGWFNWLPRCSTHHPLPSVLIAPYTPFLRLSIQTPEALTLIRLQTSPFHLIIFLQRSPPLISDSLKTLRLLISASLFSSSRTKKIDRLNNCTRLSACLVQGWWGSQCASGQHPSFQCEEREAINWRRDSYPRHRHVRVTAVDVMTRHEIENKNIPHGAVHFFKWSLLLAASYRSWSNVRLYQKSSARIYNRLFYPIHQNPIFDKTLNEIRVCLVVHVT